MLVGNTMQGNMVIKVGKAFITTMVSVRTMLSLEISTADRVYLIHSNVMKPAHQTGKKNVTFGDFGVTV